MPFNSLLEEIERRLNAKTIHDLRQVARAVGVPRPADGRKERIVEYMLKIASGEADPATPAVRGAHPKSAEYDRQLVADILRCREVSLSKSNISDGERVELSVSDGEKKEKIYESTFEGLLEKRDGKWFIRINGTAGDVFVNSNLVNMFSLREGDIVKCECARTSPDEYFGVSAVLSVNGLPSVGQSARASFENLTPVYPDKKFSVALSAEDIAGRIIDLFSPVGAGQRAFIIYPHGADKTSFLKNFAKGLKNNNGKLKVVILLLDCAPEVAADFKRSFADAEVFASKMDEGAAAHLRTANLALEYAKRRVELSEDVALIVDGITALTRALNSCGKQVSSALDFTALDGAKRFLAAARNAEEGGSLTVISTLSKGEGDVIDGAIYSGLKDIGNMRITLLPQMTRTAVVDISRSGAANENRLLSESELNAAYTLREKYSAEQIVQLFKQTSSNAELCSQIEKEN